MPTAPRIAALLVLSVVACSCSVTPQERIAARIEAAREAVDTGDLALSVTPDALGQVEGMIAVSGHDIYSEMFDVIEAFGTLGGVAIARLVAPVGGDALLGHQIHAPRLRAGRPSQEAHREAATARSDERRRAPR